jgi:hypothetical protein
MSFTVSVAPGANDFNLSVLVQVLTGATEAGGTFAQNGGTTPANSSVTPNFSNSWIGATAKSTGSTNYTASANNTALVTPGTNNGPYYMGWYSATVTAGTPVTVGANNSTAAEAWAIYEVPPAGGSTPVVDGSSPALVTNGGTGTATTASFTPPPGSVLVAFSTAGTLSTDTATISDTSGLGLVWTKRATFVNASTSIATVWTATVPAPADQLLVPRRLPGPQRVIRQYRPHLRQLLAVPPSVAAAAGALAGLQQRGQNPGRARSRARVGGRGLCAAGILATGIGPPAVPAPDQPPAITHPAPHRAQWRTGQGVPPAARPQPFKPGTVYSRVQHRAQWRGGTGQPPPVVQGGGSLQPFRPVTIYRRVPHGAVWRSGKGTPPAAQAQPTRPVTVWRRTPHRAIWDGIAGTAVTVTPGLGTPQPMRPVTVWRRTPHRVIWQQTRGIPPAAKAQPFKPATVFRRIAHRALWRAGAGQPAPFVPPPPFTIGALTAADQVLAALTAADRAGTLTAATTASTALDLYFSDTYLSDEYGAAAVTAGVLSATSSAASQQTTTQARGGPG